MGLTTRSLAVDSGSEVACLGFYVRADVWGRRCQPAKAREQVERAIPRAGPT